MALLCVCRRSSSSEPPAPAREAGASRLMDQEGSCARRLDLPSGGGIRSCQACVGERGWGAFCARRRDGFGRHSSCWGSATRLRPSSDGGPRLIPMARVPRLWRGEPPRRRRGSAPWRLARKCQRRAPTNPSTHDLNQVFAIVCCTEPPRLRRIGCGQPPRGGAECAGDVCRCWV